MKARGLVVLAILSALVIVAQAPGRGAAAATLCPSPYASMVKTLTAMEAQVQVGVNYSRYENLLVKVRTAYDRLPTNTASLACLNAVGIPSEQAMNNYIQASNSWNACNGRVTAGLARSCVGPGSYGEASRQIYWQRASASIQKAVNNLG
jgi:hypothetical protein